MRQKPRALTLVLNPNARKPRLKPPSLDRLQKAAGPGAKVHVTRSLEELDRLMRAWKREQETVCFYGGDGSISRGLTSLIRHQGEGFELPPVLAVRAGTINMLCSILGFREPVERTLGRWNCNELNTIRQVSTLRIQVGREDPHYGFVFAWGVGYRILREYYARRPAPDATDGVAVLCKTAANALLPNAMDTPMFRAEDVGLRIDGTELSCEPIRALTIGTIERVSLGIRPFPPEPILPGSFHYSASALTAMQTARHMHSLLYQLGDQRKLARRYPRLLACGTGAKELRAVLSEGFTLDGEMYEIPAKTEVRISAGPVVRFWIPGI